MSQPPEPGLLEMIPHIGIGDLRFGMNPEQVAALLGPWRSMHRRLPWDVGRRQSEGRITEYRDALDSPVVSYVAGHADVIALSCHQAGLIFRGLRVFGETAEAFVQHLERAGGPLVQVPGIVLSPGLGMGIGGLNNHSGTQDIVGVFARQEGGELDAMLRVATPFPCSGSQP